MISEDSTRSKLPVDGALILYESLCKFKRNAQFPFAARVNV